MRDALIDVIAYRSPLAGDAILGEFEHGKSIAEIMYEQDYPLSMVPNLKVTLSNGERSDVIPRNMWMQVKPKAGTHVDIRPVAHGAFLAPLLTALVNVASPYIAGSVLGAGASVGALKLATTAISLVLGLAINALIKPPSIPSANNDPVFTITGVQNSFNPFGVVPQVWGRHMMFPTLTATGYTEVNGTDIYYRGRMTFGVGPDISLEQLKIGTTPISEFDDVSIEFRNVDRDLTEADIPELAGMDVKWRYGVEQMSLYPNDITEDTYNVLMEQNVDVVRVTRPDTLTASLDISFQALGGRNSEGRSRNVDVDVDFHYRLVGDVDWISAGSETYSGSDQKFRRFVKNIFFPTKGTYDIAVTRTNEEDDRASYYDDAFLTAIRSDSGDSIPSHPDISEITFRVRATEQLNGQIDSLNAIVNRLIPVWDGTSWSAPQKSRHPADIIPAMLRGAGLAKPVSQDRINLAELITYRAEEPHWTFDIVYDGEITVREMLDQAAAAGRVRRSITEVKHSIVRDRSAGPVRAYFTPHNTWGFIGRKQFTKPLHGLRCTFISEAQDFQQDEAIVYFDGYDASNATEIEELSLIGVVIARAELDLGNVFRLARYHMAVAILRPESFEFYCGIDHLAANLGDKIKVSHDVTKWGIGSARIVDLTVEASRVTQIMTDEAFELDTSTIYAMRIRDKRGVGHLINVTVSSGYTRTFEVSESTPITILEVMDGNMILVEEIGSESMDLLITGRTPNSDLTALITAVPAAPEVLEADTSTIPAYDPNITMTYRREVYGPAAAKIVSAVSDETVMIYEKNGSVTPVLSVIVEADPVLVQQGTMVALQWREQGKFELWNRTSFVNLSGAALVSSRLIEDVTYEYQVITVSRLGRAGEPTSIATIKASAISGPPPKVQNFAPNIGESQISWSWTPLAVPDVKEYEMRRSPSISANWNSSVLVGTTPHPGSSTVTPLRAGRYFIRAKDLSGNYSEESSIVDISENVIKKVNLVETLSISPDFSGDLDNLERVGTNLRLLKSSNDQFALEGVLTSDQTVDLGAVFSCVISADFDATTDDGSVFMDQWPTLSSVSVLAGQEITDGSVNICYRATEDDPSSPSAIWTEWTPIVVSTVSGRAFQFQMKLSTFNENTSPLVTRADFIVDMPDRFENEHNVSVPSGGLNISYSAPFRVTPSFLITPRPNSPTDRYFIENETASGCYVRFETVTGSATSGVIDWHAQGYGRQQS